MPGLIQQTLFGRRVDISAFSWFSKNATSILTSIEYYGRYKIFVQPEMLLMNIGVPPPMKHSFWMFPKILPVVLVRILPPPLSLILRFNNIFFSVLPFFPLVLTVGRYTHHIHKYPSSHIRYSHFYNLLFLLKKYKIPIFRSMTFNSCFLYFSLSGKKRKTAVSDILTGASFVGQF